jgi:peptide/nickel transport system permease protein
MDRPSTFQIEFNLSEILAAPSGSHLLGTDAFGRDVFHLILISSLGSLQIAAACITITLILSLLCTLVWATSPRLLKSIEEQLLDILWIFPSILLSILLCSTQTGGILGLSVSIAIGSTPALSKILISKVKSVLSEEFALASLALGARPLELWKIHALPAILELLKWKSPQLILGSILTEAALTYLGVGASPQASTWGTLILQAKDYLIEAPHLMLAMLIPLFIVSTFTSVASTR